ncbi:hypothetical protein Hanom_Chr04g00379931 [Helianthus anomalus]
MLKHNLNSSGLLGIGEPGSSGGSSSPVRLRSLDGPVSAADAESDSGDWRRLRLLARRERVAAVCEIERKWMMKGLAGERWSAAAGEGMTNKRRRRSSDKREDSRANRALLSIVVVVVVRG